MASLQSSFAALVTLLALSVGIGGCQSNFDRICRAQIDKARGLDVGAIDSVEIDQAPFQKDFDCLSLCFSILHHTGLPVLFHVEAGDAAYRPQPDDVPGFYDFLKVPGNYRYTFVDTTECRQRADHDRDPQSHVYGAYVQSCIRVEPAGVYGLTVRIVPYSPGQVASENGSIFTYNRAIYSRPILFERKSTVLGSIDNVSWKSLTSATDTDCIGDSYHLGPKRFEMEDLILGVLRRGEAAYRVHASPLVNFGNHAGTSSAGSRPGIGV